MIFVSILRILPFLNKLTAKFDLLVLLDLATLSFSLHLNEEGEKPEFRENSNSEIHRVQERNVIQLQW